MKLLKKGYVIFGMAFCLATINAHASTITLDSSNICANNGSISVSDVQGATHCFGDFSGNLNSNDQISYMGYTYNELTKIDGAGSANGSADIGFQITGANSKSGTWSFNHGSLDGNFLVLLNASKSFALWSFEADDATAYTGYWNTNLKNNGGKVADLSHISIYGTVSVGTSSTQQNAVFVPEPAVLSIFLAGLGLVALRRNRK